MRIRARGGGQKPLVVVLVWFCCIVMTLKVGRKRIPCWCLNCGCLDNPYGALLFHEGSFLIFVVSFFSFPVFEFIILMQARVFLYVCRKKKDREAVGTSWKRRIKGMLFFDWHFPISNNKLRLQVKNRCTEKEINPITMYLFDIFANFDGFHKMKQVIAGLKTWIKNGFPNGRCQLSPDVRAEKLTRI